MARKHTLDRKQYEKPPLVEVFCEFFFENAVGQEWDWFIVPKLYNKLRGKFPRRKHIRSVGVQFRMEPLRGVQDLETLGPPTPRHQFFSEDSKSLVQVGENLLVVNQLPPYYGWERFEPLVIDCFETYCTLCEAHKRRPLCSSTTLTRWMCPKQTSHLKIISTFTQSYPGRTPVTNLAMAFEVRGADEGDILAVAFRQHPSANPEGTSFLLQFDYVATRPREPSLETIRYWLQTAHDFASGYFRSTITAKCEKLFQLGGVTGCLPSSVGRDRQSSQVENWQVHHQPQFAVFTNSILGRAFAK